MTSSLLNKEIKRTWLDSSHSNAPVNDNRGRNKNRHTQNKVKSRGRSNVKKDVTCYRCGKKAKKIHLSTPTLRSYFSPHAMKSVNLAWLEMGNWLWHLLLSRHKGKRHCKRRDSAKEFFTSLQEYNLCSVKMGNKNSLQILGICDICITTIDEVKIILKIMWDLFMNFASIPSLCIS